MEEFDFEGNEAWREYSSRLLVQPGPRAAAVLRKKKIRWYQNNIDASYVPPAEEEAPAPAAEESKGREEEDKPQPGSTDPPPASAPPPPAPTPPSRTVGIALSYALLAAHSVALLLALATALPFLSPLHPVTAFKTMLQLSAAAQVVTVYRAHGRPQLSKDFARRVAMDEESHFVFWALLLLTYPSPSLLPAVPVAGRALLFVCRSAEALVQSFRPSLAPSVRPLCARVTSQAVALYVFNASMEVYTAVMAPFALLTGGGSILVTVMLWQYLRVRYVLAQSTRTAFAQFRASADRLFCHPSCPGAVSAAWRKMCSVLHSMVDPAQQQARPSCSVM